MRDFSEETKQEILGIVTAVESEAWWNPFKWDCWYHIADAIGQLDLPADGVGLMEYYRKVIDKDDIGKTEINRIFDEVYQVEEAYCRHLTTLRSSSDNILLGLQKINEAFV